MERPASWAARLAAAATVALVVGACDRTNPSGNATPSAPTATTIAPSPAVGSPTPTPDASPSPPDASPSPTVVPGATPMPESENAMQPGRYGFPGFVPTLTFRVGPGWAAGHELSDFFDVDDIRHRAAVVVFADLGFVYDEHGVRRDVAGMTPREAASVLAVNPVLGAGTVTTATVGGVRGAAVELTPRGGHHVFGRTVIYAVAPSRGYRLTFVRAGGTMLVVLAVAIHRPPDRAFTLADRVIRSVRFA